MNIRKKANRFVKCQEYQLYSFPVYTTLKKKKGLFSVTYPGAVDREF